MAVTRPQICRCAIGRHPRRARLEQRLANGESLYKVGLELGVSRETVRRHWKYHVINKDELIRRVNLLRPAEAIAQAASDAAIEPLELCARKNAVLEAAFQEQRGAGNWELALAIDKRQIDWSIYQSKLTGPLRKIDTVNLVQNNFGSDWRELEHRMIAAARANPCITLVDFLHQIRQPAAPVMIEASAE